MTTETTWGPFDAEHPPPLQFDAWAALSASMLKRSPEEHLAILEAREMDVELWDACNLFWLTELSDQIARGNHKMAERYGKRCAEELKSRETDRAALAFPDVEPDPDPDATAFMTALHDDTALPFASPFAEPLPFDPPSPNQNAAEGPARSSPHPDVGETQEVTLPSLDLPFKPKS